ncbi:OmpA family protein [bacterium]|nr:OmpA family protein [bacterium]
MDRGRKKKKGGEEGAPAWMVTYGDMMTLLLCFFVMLVSMSSIQESKFRKAMGSLKGALGVMKFDSSIIEMESLPTPTRYQQEIERIRKEFEEFEEFAELAGLEDKVEISETDEGMLIRMANPLLYGSGSSSMKEEGKKVLSELFTILENIDAVIRVEGHTDDVPIHNEEFSSNWDLSSSRAVKVLTFLAENGIKGEDLMAVGCGQYKPLVSNDSEENRAKNRRVEIYVNYKDKLEKEKVRDMTGKGENNG